MMRPAPYPTAPWAFLLPGLAALALPAAADEPPTGEAIYQQRCASCHGNNGEGTPEEYPKPLIGKSSVNQLAKLIAKTMPADDPGTCTGAEAQRVADYIYNAFYSPTAQARNKPARVELSRLTVRQYRNAVADLIGSFRGGESPTDQRGLKAEYFKSRRMRGQNRALERIDPEVRFDFGTETPDYEHFGEPAEFAIRWDGSVFAPETGDYEFIARTDHAVRVWVNNERQPLIDAFVKSGNDTEYRQTITLLGGRWYRLRMEFMKGKQGGSDKAFVGPPKPMPAFVALHWKVPGRVEEVIPQRHLAPAPSPERYVVTTPFPPDDRSIGYERGTSVSMEWEASQTAAALETTAYVVAHLNELAGTRDDDPDRSEKLKAFARTFAERAFRRPLSDELAEIVVERQFREAKDATQAVKRAVLLTLKTPRFLYRDLGTRDGYDTAARLSFVLWDSLPDAPLLEAAAKGELATREQIAAQAERMLDDARARAKVRDFFFQRLKVDLPPDLAKDTDLFPDFDEALASDLRASLDLFLDRVVWDESSDFRRLFLAETLPLNGRLARYYGADVPGDAPFQDLRLDDGARAGLLTHPYLLASFSYTAASSPIHRGVFISRGILGRTLRPPPEAVAPLAPDLHPDLTTRERVVLQTQPESCQSCHNMINPLGFALENFDAVGRYRREEKGRPIDATGAYAGRTGESITYNGARELAQFLADSDEVHTAFAEGLFHYLVKQPIRAFGPDLATELQQTFVQSKFNIRKLIATIAAASAMARTSG
jgi:mono/diheme cytochrome c family protein